MKDEWKLRLDLSLKSSMLHWYPKTRDLKIPQPRTMLLQLSQADIEYICRLLDGKPLSVDLEAELFEGADSIGYPLFMRSDSGSGKHRWNNTCFVQSRDKIKEQLANLVEWHGEVDVVGLPFRAIAFREYINMDSKFCAFNGLPISPERRYFIRQGEIEDHCTYWPEDAIKFYESTRASKVLDWKRLLAEMNRETPEEIELLTGYTMDIARYFHEYWSVDYCRAFNGTWYMIDMARGEISWNPKNHKKDEKATSSLLDGVI